MWPQVERKEGSSEGTAMETTVSPVPLFHHVFVTNPLKSGTYNKSIGISFASLG
jgi:hypothetical protein